MDLVVGGDGFTNWFLLWVWSWVSVVDCGGLVVAWCGVHWSAWRIEWVFVLFVGEDWVGLWWRSWHIGGGFWQIGMALWLAPMALLMVFFWEGGWGGVCWYIWKSGLVWWFFFFNMVLLLVWWFGGGAGTHEGGSVFTVLLFGGCLVVREVVCSLCCYLEVVWWWERNS